MSERLKSLVFAAGLCLILSLLLTTASTGLQEYQQRNIVIDKQANILKSVGLVAEGQTVSPESIASLYQANIQAIWIDSTGRRVAEAERGQQDIPLYLYKIDDTIKAYVIPINSRGLWGRIHGYLALENDGSTISGFTVYKHSETPGLGGEIEKSWFQKNWIGKKIVDQAGQFASIRIAKGSVSDQVPDEQQMNYVDGISGATLTGKYLTAGIRQILEEYEPVSIRFRNNKIDSSVMNP
jgi:Na+-transporting NADH:ubiquinone oxidoreductase subunit C